ncbi:MAG TPA: GDSL family lipase, partial [Lachnospiraceae bacterium]|nr:GDSL family lipase [Lachnospiraceae bacterium]
IREAVEGYAEQTADSRIHFLQLPDTTPDTVGSRLHPGMKAHQITAKEIEKYLQELL